MWKLGRFGCLIGLVILAFGCAEMPRIGAPAPTATFYVAPDGSDSWSGRLARPNADRTDGPLASLTGARDAIRRLKATAGLHEGVRVLVEEGTYRVTEPLVLGPEDSGTAECPITYTGPLGKTAVISGGREIKGWKKDRGRWVTRIPQAQTGEWYFSALWVNGERRTRARTPNQGYFYTAGTAPPLPAPKGGKPISRGKTAFRFKPGDVKAWDNLNDIVVVVYHSWETSLHRIASVDEEARTVTFTGPAVWPFQRWGPKQRYHVENLPEALDAPGEWYLDRTSGVLSYIPKAWEDLNNATVVAPVATQLIVLNGKPAEGKFVAHVRFENLRLLHTEWVLPPQGHSDPQAVVSVCGAVQATGARRCAIQDCEIGHAGTYGVWLRAGCQENMILHCEIHDLGAGGVRIGECASAKTEAEAAQRNVVENNFIHDGGKTFAGAVGAWIGRSSHNTLSHNEICDFYYTGVSVGWSWGYAPTSANHNIIEYNHIHEIGRGVLGDMGGIYTLGDSPGTVLRNNVVHDVYDFHTGSLAIYMDEGSTGILIENNIGYNTAYANFHQHYGKENIVRNNIWAFGRGAQVSRARQEEHISFTFERNIVYFDNGNLLRGGWTNGKFRMDNNLYWDTSHPKGDIKFGDMTFGQWQAQGHDRHSIIADPMFVSATARDFRLKPESPASKIGFQPIDASAAGLYGEVEWVDAPKRVTRQAFRYQPPPPPRPTPIQDGFEDLPAGVEPEGPRINAENEAANILVSDEAAASGKHSLKFTDAPGQRYSFNPHMYYVPDFTQGVIVEGFDLRMEKGVIADFQWRDAASPYHVGPAVRVEADGRVLSKGKEIGHVPLGQWMHFEIRCALGSKAKGSFDLRFGPVGGKMTELKGLPCDPNFRELRWLGFVSDAKVASVFYVDNISLRAAWR